jgi:hypothetical protein
MDNISTQMEAHMWVKSWMDISMEKENGDLEKEEKPILLKVHSNKTRNMEKECLNGQAVTSIKEILLMITEMDREL